MDEIGLNEFLQLIIADKGGSINQYNQLMDYIAYHETGRKQRMDPKARQITSSGKKDGVGRGLFMFESGEKQGGNTAANRTVNYLNKKNIAIPTWLNNIWSGKKSVDASKLTADQQKMLFLGYHREHPTSDFSKIWKGEQSIENFWLNNHWSGKSQSSKAETLQKLLLFKKNMVVKDSVDAIKIKKQELFGKKDTVPFVAPSQDVDSLPDIKSVHETIFGTKESSLLKDYDAYETWEEGAMDNPQSEIWQGKPNPYRHPSATMTDAMMDPLYWTTSIPKYAVMGGIAASGSSMFNSASSAEASLNKITWTFLVIFLSLAIILSAGWIS